MMFEAELEIALHSTAPSNQLQILAEQLRRRGESKETLLSSFERYRVKLRSSGRDRDSEVLLEAMDYIRGW